MHDFLLIDLSRLLHCGLPQVPVLLIMENGPLREVVDLCEQPWFKLYHFLMSWRPDLDIAEWGANTKSLAGNSLGPALCNEDRLCFQYLLA